MSHRTHGRVLDCEAIVRALWDYLDRRCDPERHALIDEHLALCESCRSHAEFERRLLEMLRDVGRNGDDPTELRLRIVRALRQAVGEGEDPG